MFVIRCVISVEPCARACAEPAPHLHTPHTRTTAGTQSKLPGFRLTILNHLTLPEHAPTNPYTRPTCSLTS